MKVIVFRANKKSELKLKKVIKRVLHLFMEFRMIAKVYA